MDFREESLPHPVEEAEYAHSIFTLATFGWEGSQTIRRIAESEPPPQARTWGERIENCQVWCVRVVKKLVEQGMVEAQKIEMLEKMMQFIKLIIN